jgi:hypothetical protein
MSVSKCDIIRDAASAASCGLCTSKTRPLGCGDIPMAACSVPTAANSKLQLFDLENRLQQDIVTKAERNVYQMKINTANNDLTKAYKVAADTADIDWMDYQFCLWNKRGTPGGPNNNKHFNRLDVMELGMKPVYPIGGKTATTAFWKGDTSPLPVLIDYIMNPQLFAIVMFVLLVLIYVAVVYLVYKRYRKHHGDTISVAQA